MSILLSAFLLFSNSGFRGPETFMLVAVWLLFFLLNDRTPEKHFFDRGSVQIVILVIFTVGVVEENLIILTTCGAVYILVSALKIIVINRFGDYYEAYPVHSYAVCVVDKPNKRTFVFDDVDSERIVTDGVDNDFDVKEVAIGDIGVVHIRRQPTESKDINFIEIVAGFNRYADTN